MTLRAVVFDWGGVLTVPMRDAFLAWAAADGVDPAHFHSVMRSWLDHRADRPGEAEGVVAETPVHALERGHMDPSEFERVMAAALAAQGSPVPAQGLLERMLAALVPLVPEMMALVGAVRSAGLRTAVLSNSWGEHYPDEVFAREFDAVVISGRVGLRKPQKEIYELVARELGLPPGECLLVDDIEVNVLAARAAGMPAVLHVDARQTRRAVEDLMGTVLAVDRG